MGSDPFYVSNVVVSKVGGVHRRAELPAGGAFDMGVHGAIKAHYKLDTPDLPLPVDYVVASAVG
ncbi:MAG: hypothetical protein P8Y29_04230 [Gemmatimonadota bacterium]|jgi:hypothetical protein